MRATLLSATAIAGLAVLPAIAQEREFPAFLEGQTILPAATLIAAPGDAPATMAVVGKYTGQDRRRVDAVGTVPGKDGVRTTGLSLPFEGQPVQGFSGIRRAADGTFWSLSDNGFGSKMNSVDAALMLHHIGFDWQTGEVSRLETVFLTDPNRMVPYPIINEGTTERYLTGSDFDIESIQPVADGFWIGDEFGPFLIKVDMAGRVVAVVETIVDGKPVRSPDHPALTLQGQPDPTCAGLQSEAVRRIRRACSVARRNQALRSSGGCALPGRRLARGGRRPTGPAHRRVRCRRAAVDRPQLEISAVRGR